jgi:hypothetical protein
MRTVMLRRVCLRVCLTAILLATGACAQLPPDYSPNYSYIPVVSPDRPNRVHYVLAPDACLTPDLTDNRLGAPRLPPGCANAYNLQRMADRQGDLVRGRPLGPAPASPAARAAQKYIYGNDGALGAGFGKSEGPSGAPSNETAQPVTTTTHIRGTP